MHGGLAVVVDGIDVAAELEQEINCFEGFCLGSRFFAGGERADSGGSHQRRAVIGVGKKRVGSEFQQ